MKKPATLYLIPTPLGEGLGHTLPAQTLDILFSLDYFIVERGKTARAFLKSVQFPTPLQSLEFRELSEHTPALELPVLLAPVLEGRSAGLLSEAGCPGVADPGAPLVALAHRHGVEVVPLVGPSSILLALMASGMNGQRFCFQGYLSAKKPELARQLRQLEQQSAREGSTQVFIETPYRSQAMLESLLGILAPSTRLCLAVDLTLPEQYIRSMPVAQWRKEPVLPALAKRPAVFLISG